MTGPVLICFDDSESSRAALDAATALFAAHDAIVACYWQPFASSSKPFAVDILELVQEPDAINEREEQLARALAEEGALLAREGGLNAEARAIEIDGPIDEAILLHAEELDAAAIVLDARSRSGVRSLLLGDTANEVAQRATQPVFVVPSRPLGKRRRDALRNEVEAETTS